MRLLPTNDVSHRLAFSSVREKEKLQKVNKPRKRGFSQLLILHNTMYFGSCFYKN